MVLLQQRNKPMSMHAFKLLQTKIMKMFCSSFEPFNLEGFIEPWGYHILSPFSLVINASSYGDSML